MSRELRRLQDTNEFAHIDEKPVRHTVWSNGKYLDPDEVAAEKEAPPAKKPKVEKDTQMKDIYEVEEDAKPTPPTAKPKRIKKWLSKGLYAGQEPPSDVFKGLTPQEKKKLLANPDLIPHGTPNKALPMPIFTGLRQLINGRDFKLPFHVMNPLPPGQARPPAYRTITKSKSWSFCADEDICPPNPSLSIHNLSISYGMPVVLRVSKQSRRSVHRRRSRHLEEIALFQDSSTCVCKPEDGCDEDCQNRIMLYECDDKNCNIGKDLCGNRAFQDLSERTKKGRPYRIGVDVVKTNDRGFGVRSNRAFAPGQIIMEYTGEIITEEECERRMNEEYKENEVRGCRNPPSSSPGTGMSDSAQCYYLMSFDQNMIIDATTGSIARFVNHSCSPNCRMIKWIVSGQPRMALFAGDYPIMSGDELTYDYNFDPFSAKNVQKCLCGSPNCRGVLGPKTTKDVKRNEEKKVAKGASAKASPKSKGSGSSRIFWPARRTG